MQINQLNMVEQMLRLKIMKIIGDSSCQKFILLRAHMHQIKIKGIGPKRLALLEELNIKSVEDLVLYLPTRYEDNTVIDLNQADDQATVTVQGEVYSSPTVAFLVVINRN